ncbi:MAG TPA: TonB C-terminal domain-containing protein [Telluria sp.]|jgi:protein TonB
MSYAPAFLARLGIDATADERVIRRAYARLLKQVDQETEAPRFQSLREDYEEAIAWCAWRDRHEHKQHIGDSVAADGAQHAPPAASVQRVSAPPQPQYGVRTAQKAAPAAPLAPLAPEAAAVLTESIDPDALGGEVFWLFQSILPRLRGERLQFDESLWADHLRRCLADQRLINLGAGAAFEARIVGFLAGPHQPGHGTLFSAAVNVFGWAADRRRLHRLHQSGEKINRAIDERIMFNAQDMKDRRAQKQVFAALRSRALPHPDDLRRLMPLLETMIARFPVLMSILVGPEAVGRWRLAFSGPARAAAERAGTDTSPEPFYDSGSSVGFWWIVAILLVTFILAKMLAPSAPPVPLAAVGGASWPHDRPAGRGDAPLRQAHVNEIKSHFRYMAALNARPAIRTVAFAVHLDPSGKIDSLRLLRESRDRHFDNAAETAVRETGAFPGASAGSFTLTFTGLIAPGEVRIAIGAEPGKAVP